MIGKRTLTKWRKEALVGSESIKASARVEDNWTEPILNRSEALNLCEHILALTQELTDQYLIKGI